MTCGKMVAIDRGSGSGLAVRASHIGRTPLGSSPGCTKRGVAYMATGIEGGYRVSKALLDIGMRVEKGSTLPVRMKIIFDGSTVAREFKPQFACDGEDGTYAKAVYDIKPIAAAKIQERARHRLVVLYDASRRVDLDDVGLLVFYDVPEAWSSYIYMAGVVPIKPNEEVIFNLKLPESQAIAKNLYVNLVLPSRFSEVEIRAGNTVRLVSGVVGPALVEAPVRFKGGQLRVSVDYRGLARPVYPRIAYVTGLVLMETVTPHATLTLDVKNVEVEGGRARITVVLSNTGASRPEKVMLVASSLGIPLRRVEVDPVEPGESREVELPVDLSRLPASASRLAVRVVWNNYGKVYVNEVEVPLNTS